MEELFRRISKRNDSSSYLHDDRRRDEPRVKQDESSETKHGDTHTMVSAEIVRCE